MVYFYQILQTYLLLHFPTTSMQNDDKAKQFRQTTESRATGWRG